MNPQRSLSMLLGSIGVVIFCGILGVLVALGYLTPQVIAALAIVFAVVYKLTQPQNRHLINLEAPVILLLLSVVQWRGRALSTSSSEPVDLIVMLRLVFEATAAVLATASLLDRHTTTHFDGGLAPFGLLTSFAAVSAVGAVLAVSPTLALYQGVQIGIALLVVAAALRTNHEPVPRLMRVIFWFTVGIVSLTWAEALVAPARAFPGVQALKGAISSPIPVRLVGVYPETNSDTVGTYGAILAIWGAGILLSGEAGVRRSRYVLICALGLVTLLFSQYRTGYAVVIVGGMVLVLFLARRRFFAVAAASVCVLAIAAVAVAANSETISTATSGLALRGQTDRVAESGTGRTPLWRGEIKVWEESPIVGHGLISASRYEVIGPAGGELNQAHSTWFEALGGTGSLGTLMLAAAVLTTGYTLFKRRLMIPTALWSGLTVLSITDGSLAYLSYGFVVFLLLISWGADGRSLAGATEFSAATRRDQESRLAPRGVAAKTI